EGAQPPAPGKDRFAVDPQATRLGGRYVREALGRVEQAGAPLCVLAVDLPLDHAPLVRHVPAPRDLDQVDPRIGVVALRGYERLCCLLELPAARDAGGQLLLELRVLLAQVGVD